MDWSQCSAGGANGVPTINCIPQLFTVIVFYAFLFAGILAVILIIWSGAKYIRSGGDTKQTQGARQTLTFSIIGLILVLGSMFVLNIIATVTGAKCILTFGFGSCGGAVTTDQSTHQGDFGCFPSTDPTQKPSCYLYDVGNNPKVPYQWFPADTDNPNQSTACNTYCATRQH